MRAVLSVIGKDTVGLMAKVSGVCYEHNVSIVDVTQSVLQDMFVMVMMVEITDMNCGFDEFTQRMNDLGGEIGVNIHVMHEDIFNAMHRI